MAHLGLSIRVDDTIAAAHALRNEHRSAAFTKCITAIPPGLSALGPCSAHQEETVSCTAVQRNHRYLRAGPPDGQAGSFSIDMYI